jgi:hypothetical protein
VRLLLGRGRRRGGRNTAGQIQKQNRAQAGHSYATKTSDDFCWEAELASGDVAELEWVTKQTGSAGLTNQELR